MTRRERLDLLKAVDFGDIDGYGDPNLEEYFLDNNYWETVVNGKTYFVTGRKGTGKSSVYRMIKEQGREKGVQVENKDFGDFPFEKLLQLDDQSFSKPNQYQSIWENLILNVFAITIAHSEVCMEPNNEHYQQIQSYVKNCVGDDIVEMHRVVIERTSKTSAGLNFKFVEGELEYGKTLSIGNAANNISAINSTLENLILNYFLTCSENAKVIIQFDRLDDNYNQYQNLSQYYHAIISLFKVVYHINQEFRSRRIERAKVVLYLRSDIFKELGKLDAESARWSEFRQEIDWAIVNRYDWSHSKLLQMINKRIYVSLKRENVGFEEIFDKDDINLQSRSGRTYNVFQYMVERTMHRPRDLIQFCKYVQQEAVDTDTLFFRTIKNAEKDYGFWLVSSEIANEINPVLKNTDALFELLRQIGSKPFSLSDYYDRYKSVSNLGLESETLIYYLYDIGIIQNIDTSKKPVKFRSSYRNKGKLDRNMKMIIHPGVWTGINA